MSNFNTKDWNLDVFSRRNQLSEAAVAAMADANDLGDLEYASTEYDAVHNILGNIGAWFAKQQRGQGGLGIVVPASGTFWRVTVPTGNTTMRPLDRQTIERFIEHLREAQYIWVNAAGKGRARSITPRDKARALFDGASLVTISSRARSSSVDSDEGVQPPTSWLQLNRDKEAGKGAARVPTAELIQSLTRDGKLGHYMTLLDEMNTINTNQARHTWTWKHLATPTGIELYEDLGNISGATTTFRPESLMLTRTFSNGLYAEAGGRHYSPAISALLTEHRPHLQCNGEDVVEADFKSMHPMLAYLWEGLEPPFDMYAIRLSGTWQPPRSLVKCALLTALNGGGIAGIRSSLAMVYSKKLRGWQLAVHHGHVTAEPKASDFEFSDQQIGLVLSALRAKHHAIGAWLSGDSLNGCRLMYIESEIAHRVLLEFASAGCAILPVYDGFMVPKSLAEFVVSAMVSNFNQVTGHQLAYTSIDVDGRPFQPGS